VVDDRLEIAVAAQVVLPPGERAEKIPVIRGAVADLGDHVRVVPQGAATLEDRVRSPGRLADDRHRRQIDPRDGGLIEARHVDALERGVGIRRERRGVRSGGGRGWPRRGLGRAGHDLIAQRQGGRGKAGLEPEIQRRHPAALRAVFGMAQHPGCIPVARFEHQRGTWGQNRDDSVPGRWPGAHVELVGRPRLGAFLRARRQGGHDHHGEQ